MPRTYIAAHTNPGTAYPGFVAIHQNEDGSVEVMVRAEGIPERCGDIVSVKLSKSDFVKMLHEAVGNTSDTQHLG
jgi:hypothetical protein